MHQITPPPGIMDITRSHIRTLACTRHYPAFISNRHLKTMVGRQDSSIPNLQRNQDFYPCPPEAPPPPPSSPSVRSSLGQSSRAITSSMGSPLRVSTTNNSFQLRMFLHPLMKSSYGTGSSVRRITSMANVPRHESSHPLLQSLHARKVVLNANVLL